jgi:hypothetical protein
MMDLAAPQILTCLERIFLVNCTSIAVGVEMQISSEY